MSESQYRFAEFQLDCASFELRRQGRAQKTERISLERIPMELLILLLERQGSVVTRQEIVDRLWGKDVFVDTEHGINTAIRKVRQALRDDPEQPRFILTISGKGYRFVAERSSTNGTSAIAAPATEAVVPPQPPATPAASLAPAPKTLPRPGYRFIAPLEGGSALITASGSPVVAEAGRQPRIWPILLKIMVAGVGAGAAAFLILHLSTRTKDPHSNFERMGIRQISKTGDIREAAISPDGKYIAYVREYAGQVSTTSAVQIVPPGQDPYTDLTFSPDGSYLLYRRVLRSEGTGQLEEVPALGGSPKKLVEEVDGGGTFSPDGTRLAFVRNDPPKSESLLVVVNTDGTNERILARHSLADLFCAPAWSPDGKLIAAGSGGFMPQSLLRLSLISVGNGKEEFLTAQEWASLGGLSWLADGSGLVMTGQIQGRSNDAGQVWYLPYPNGEAHQITNDLSNYVGVTVTHDSQNLLTVRKERTSAIWLVAKGPSARALPITFAESRADGLFGLCWTPEGKIVYSSRADGTSELWVMKADGSQQQQLTANGAFNADPVALPDGRSVIFTSSRAGGNHLLWRIDIDGSNSRQLTHGRDEFQADVSPDGTWMVFTSTESGKTTIWKSPLENGRPVQLEKELSWFPAVSRDGRWIAYILYDEGKHKFQISIVPDRDGPATRAIDVPPAAGSLGLLRWTPDGRSLALVETHDGVDNIWSNPLDSRSHEQLTKFSSGQIFGFDWSPDGNRLAVARGSLSSDIILINNFR
jgi:Tol biopolymer transport system component/DNA-binding winged helix-turn-helix (wHTH) protein